MKKIVIIGSGTAGLIAAAMINNYWKDEVSISCYYNANSKNIAVGERTTPLFRLLLAHLGISTEEFIKNLNGKVSVKLGINFKNWIPNMEYFHGFQEITPGDPENKSSFYSIVDKKFNGGVLDNEATTTIPNQPFETYNHAYHIDTQELSEYLFKKLGNKVNFIDDIVEKVNTDGKNITSLEFKNGGNVEADFYIDASGFNTVLFKHLNPKWNDLLDCLPIDRAIPQQVSYDFKEIPSYTLAEATENGWIWQIPIGKRYGTGYLYSSRFTSDEEARKKYNEWLVKNFNTELQNDRIISYKPGYYEDCWIGNCMAIGLSSGFVEPLESTGIQIIISQIQEFLTINSTLKNLEYNKYVVNKSNRTLYENIVDFICLHYNTNRTDSEFWRYMTNNKTKWVKDFDEKCREEFIDSRTCYKERVFWGVDSFIQISEGLKMFDRQSIKNFLDSKIDGKDIWAEAMGMHQYIENEKKKIKKISHKKVLDHITK